MPVVSMDILACALHEWRTPLTAILSAGENIRDGLLSEAEGLREEGSIIVEQARRMIDLGDQVLLYARARGARFRRELCPLSGIEVIQDAVQSAQILLRPDRFVLQQEIPSDLPAFEGHPALLSHTLQNLIANAVKYSGHSRWIGIFAVTRKAPMGGCDEVLISVEDRGLGISQEDLPHIFEPFYRSSCPAIARLPGSGLGLSIAKACAEACGGALSVVSEKGVGSVFTLHLAPHSELKADLSRNEVGAF